MVFDRRVQAVEPPSRYIIAPPFTVKNIRHKLRGDADSPTYIFNRPRVGYLMPRGETRQ